MLLVKQEVFREIFAARRQLLRRLHERLESPNFIITVSSILLINSGTTTCNGDSGGSLSVEKDGRWFIRGMVSFGVPKKVKFEGEERSLCHPNQYSLFADVASYVDWIVENTPDISFRN